MKTHLASYAFIGLLVASAGNALAAYPDVTITVAGSPTTFTGQCPTTIEFDAAIKANGWTSAESSGLTAYFSREPGYQGTPSTPRPMPPLGSDGAWHFVDYLNITSSISGYDSIVLAKPGFGKQSDPSRFTATCVSTPPTPSPLPISTPINRVPRLGAAIAQNAVDQIGLELANALTPSRTQTDYVMASRKATSTTTTRVDTQIIPLRGGGSPYGIGDPRNPSVGYAYDTVRSGLFDSYENIIYRFGAYFDVTRYRGHKISKATLQLTVPESILDFTRTVSYCDGQEIGIASSSWFSHSPTAFAAADFSHPVVLAGNNGNTLTADITTLVQAWIDHPDQNQGIVVRSPHEDINSFTDKSCVSLIKTSALQVTP